MRHWSAYLLAFALGVAAAVMLVSCGSGDQADLLPGDTAGEINANLDTVRDLADSGDCAGAQSAAQQVSDQIDALEGVDRQLKSALREGAALLNAVVANCVETTTESVAPATTAEPKEKTTTKTSRGRGNSGKDRTTTTTPETTTTTTTTPPTETTTTPSGGGEGAPGGVAPGSAVGDEG